jgi:hypothetical protein
MLSWKVFDQENRLTEIFGANLNNPAFVRKSFSTKAIEDLHLITQSFYDRILKDEQLTEFHPVIGDPRRRVRFEKNLARFSLYLLVLDYKQILPYLVRAMAVHEHLQIPFERVYEYFLFWSARFEPWAAEHFKLSPQEQRFFRRKIDSLAFLFMKSYDEGFIVSLHSQIPEAEHQASEATVAIEEEIASLADKPLDEENRKALAKAFRRYVAHLELSDQGGSDKIATIVARFAALIEDHKSLSSQPAAAMLILDFLAKCRAYTGDHDFKQNSLGLYYLDLQIEQTLFRVFMAR